MDSLDPLIRHHLAYLALIGHAEGTITARRRRLAVLARSLPSPLADATPAMLWDWRAGLRVAPCTTRSYVSHVSCFYEWLVRENLIEENPAGELPVPRKPRRLPRPICEADLMTALDQAPPRIRLWIVLAGWCGLRACEIAGLRAECIRLRQNQPVILVAANATKGGAEHVVPVCAFAAGEILAARLPLTGWAFLRKDGQPGQNQPHVISHVANAYLHGIGIGDTLHSLRHRFATALLPHTNLRVVQESLGHASPETTALYTLVSPADGAAAVAHLPVPPWLGHRAA